MSELAKKQNVSIYVRYERTESLSVRLDFVLGACLLDVAQHFMVVGAFERSLHHLEVSAQVEHLVAFRVEVTNLADVLSALRVDQSAVRLRDSAVILDNLDCLHVALKLEQVFHHALGSLTELSVAEFVELLHPDLVEVILDLEKGLVGENLSHELGIEGHSVV